MQLSGVRKFAGRTILSVIVLLAALSVFFPAETQPVPGSLVFELALLAMLLVNRVTISKKLGLLTLGVILYLGYCLIAAVVINGTPLMDALLAFKFLGYLAILSAYRRNAVLELRDVSVFTDGLLFLFLLKYAVAQFGGFNSRPGVFYENNFELLFLLLLVGFLAGTTERGGWLRYGVTVAVIVLSGSRFAFLALVVLLMFVEYRRRSSIISAKRLLLFGTAILGSVVIFFGLLRLRPGAIDFENIDRLYFLEIFLQEVQGWGATAWLTGNRPLTPLSTGACATLSYYESLFSISNDGSCYAVILHSMILRIVLDHGLLGLFLLGLSFYWIIKAKGIDRSTTVMIVSMLAVNSFSVSSVNSPFAILAICIILSCRTRSGVMSTSRKSILSRRSNSG